MGKADKNHHTIIRQVMKSEQELNQLISYQLFRRYQPSHLNDKVSGFGISTVAI